MSLKIGTANGIREIDTNLHKPVIFINGTKRIIDKMITFVNGEKRIIYGGDGIAIDYIQSTGELAGGNVFAISDNWCNVYSGRNILRLDISNISNIGVIQNVAWGDVLQYNGYQTTPGAPIFWSSTRTSGQGQANKLSLNPTTGALTVLSSIPTNNTYNNLGFTNSYIVQYNPLSKSFYPRAGSTVVSKITYGTEYYWNGSLRYSTGRAPSSATDTSGRLMLAQGGLQIDDEVILIKMSGSYGTGEGWYRATYTGTTKINSNMDIGGLKVLDGDKILCSVFRNTTSVIFTGTVPETDFVVRDKTSLAELFRFSVADGILNRLKFLGRIGNYYYVLTMPNSTSSTIPVKITLIDATDYSTAWEKELPKDPFNENNGAATFWTSANTVVQVSQTGFLAVSTFNTTTSALRIARFSALL